MADIWSFYSAGQLVFGPGAAARTGTLVTALTLERVMLLTDPNLVRAGIAERIVDSLRASNIEALLFDEGEPEPTLEAVDRAISFARESRAEGIVGLGGGSNMDLAKMAAIVVTHGGSPRDYFGDSNVPGPIMPLVCIPTTAGTGSEVSAACVVTDRAAQLKVGVLSNFLRPRLAIVDPLLTLTCPRQVTADSGIDALTHAIEAYTAIDHETFSTESNEKTVYQGLQAIPKLCAEEAIRLVGAHLETAVREPSNPQARQAMSLAATLAGLAFSNVGVALVHALEYPLGGLVHCSHGAGNGLFLPYVMRYNLPYCTPALARVADLLKVETRHLDAAQAAMAAIERVEQIRSAIGIPQRLRELGVEQQHLPQLAEKTVAIKRMLRINPRPTTQAEALSLLESAW